MLGGKIDLDRAVSDPVYRRRVIEFLNRQEASKDSDRAPAGDATPTDDAPRADEPVPDSSAAS